MQASGPTDSPVEEPITIQPILLAILSGEC